MDRDNHDKFFGGMLVVWALGIILVVSFWGFVVFAIGRFIKIW